MQIANSAEVEVFLNSPEAPTLQIFSDGNKMKFIVKGLSEPPPKLFEVHFMKLDEEDITMD
jgi:hypothetical protein